MNHKMSPVQLNEVQDIIVHHLKKNPHATRDSVMEIGKRRRYDVVKDNLDLLIKKNIVGHEDDRYFVREEALHQRVA